MKKFLLLSIIVLLGFSHSVQAGVLKGKAVDKIYKTETNEIIKRSVIIEDSKISSIKLNKIHVICYVLD